jgi:uncharacterized protein
MTNPKKTAATTAAREAFAWNADPAVVDALKSGAGFQKIHALLHAGASPHTPDAAGHTPMDVAVERNDWMSARLLLQVGAAPPAYEGDPNAPPVFNSIQDPTFQHELARETALTYYIKNAHSYAILFTIISNGGDVNLPNANGVTPLQAAVNRQWPYVARQLVKEGAWLDPQNPDPDEIIDPKTGTTRLLSVIMEGKDQTAVKHILKTEGADPNKPDHQGLTPLALARALKWPGVEKLLIEAGADEATIFPDVHQLCGPKKDTPLLCYAASYQSCHPGYISALLENGADPNAAGPDGKSAAHWAAVYKNTWLFEELHYFGADILKPDTQYHLPPLHYACMNNAADIALYILDTEGADSINQRAGEDGKTPLMRVAGRKGAHLLAHDLIDFGAFVNMRSYSGATALSEAVSVRDVDMTRTLIHNGADVTKEEPIPARPEEADNDNDDNKAAKKPDIERYNPPLFGLVNSPNKHNADIAQILLDAGADPHAKATASYNGPQKGDSLLYFAVRYQALAFAEKILQAGVDPHDTSAKGETAMHYCLNLRQVEGVKLLLKHGFDPEKHFDYTQTWSNGREDRHTGSCLDEARKLVKQFGDDHEYGTMLRLIETHLDAQKKAEIKTTAQTRRKKPKPAA